MCVWGFVKRAKQREMKDVHRRNASRTAFSTDDKESISASRSLLSDPNPNSAGLLEIAIKSSSLNNVGTTQSHSQHDLSKHPPSNPLL